MGNKQGVTPSDVHKAAEEAGMKWDDNQDFMDLSKRVTGKEHIDDMNSDERAMLTHEIRNYRARNLDDGNPNTVWMRNEKIDGRWVAFPTLFYNEDSNNWYSMERDDQVHQAYEHARDNNELFEFGDDSTAASNFAHGDWKPTMEEKFINSIED